LKYGQVVTLQEKITEYTSTMTPEHEVKYSLLYGSIDDIRFEPTSGSTNERIIRFD